MSTTFKAISNIANTGVRVGESRFYFDTYHNMYKELLRNCRKCHRRPDGPVDGLNAYGHYRYWYILSDTLSYNLSHLSHYVFTAHSGVLARHVFHVHNHAVYVVSMCHVIDTQRYQLRFYAMQLHKPQFDEQYHKSISYY